MFFFGLIHASNPKTVLATILLCLHGHYLAYATFKFFQDSAPSLTDYPTTTQQEPCAAFEKLLSHFFFRAGKVIYVRNRKSPLIILYGPKCNWVTKNIFCSQLRLGIIIIFCRHPRLRRSAGYQDGYQDYTGWTFKCFQYHPTTMSLHHHQEKRTTYIIM